MLTDLQQSAKHWLADVIENISGLLLAGKEPAITLKIFGAEIEIRIVKLPSHKPLSVESLEDALQDAVYSVYGRPRCNPMATQCPRCRNALAKRDFCDTGDN